jgi:hypothetical protein
MSDEFRTVITPEEAMGAVGLLSSLKYFPAQGPAWVGIADVLTRLVSTTERLDWLVRELLNQVSEWPGLKEIRGLYCTKYTPADGIEAKTCCLPGYTAEDCAAAASYALPAAPRTKALLKAGEVAELIGEQWQSIEICEVDPPSRAEEKLNRDLKHEDARKRLGSMLGERENPIRIPGTRKRTPEENDQIVKELGRKCQK